jgi:hypothetical protein
MLRANGCSNLTEVFIYGNMACIQPQLAGTWDTTHQKSHVEDRKKDRNEWGFSEWGNFHADALCDIIMRLRAPNPIAPWKLESVVPWSCSFADNGDRIVGSVLSFVTITRQNNLALIINPLSHPLSLQRGKKKR